MRSNESEALYEEYKKQGGLDNGCRLCEAPALQTFTHWKIVENKFPYDLIASKHDMLVPLVHGTAQDITNDAWAELQQIRNDVINKHYDFWIEPTPHMRSIPNHMHIHVVVSK